MFGKTEIYSYATDDQPEGVYVDPLKLRRKLLTATSGRCWEWAKKVKTYESQLVQIKDLAGETPEAQRAEWSKDMAELEGRLAEAAFAAFELAPIDPETGLGVTEMTALEFLNDFLGWLEKKDERLNG